MADEYPVRLNLEGRLVVVIGGGDVTERRIDRLIDVGADVRVVAPEVTAELERFAEQGEIDWRERRYRDGDLEGARLAFAATDAPEVQSEVVDEAQRRGVPVDAVGRSAESDFTVPAVAELGSVRLSIDTGGASPALAGALRRRLEAELDPGWARAAEILAELRPVVIREFEPAVRRELFRELVADLPGALSGEVTAAAAASEERVRDVDRVRGWIERAAERAGVGEQIAGVLSAVDLGEEGGGS